jgi:cell division protein FtsW
MRTAATVLILCVGALITLGMVVLYSSSMMIAGSHLVMKQLTWCGAGLVAGLAAAMIDYRWLKRAALPLFIVSVVLLVLVLIPGIGESRGGARRWFDLKVASFQPSEFAKIALVIFLAAYADARPLRMRSAWQGVFVPGCCIVLVMGLILMEPDYGTTILLGAVSAALLLVAGVRWRHFIVPVVLAVGLLALAISQNSVRRERVRAHVEALLHPEAAEKDREGLNYQALQSVSALGAGGWAGVGLGNGRQKHGYVPEHHTDFIFAMIGEELGFIATIGVVLAYLCVVLTGTAIAWNAADTFGILLGSGLTFLIGLQAFINVGVVTMVLPNKGIALPFISYGGSNLLMMMAGVGLILSVARHAGSGVAGRAASAARREVMA